MKLSKTDVKLPTSIIPTVRQMRRRLRLLEGLNRGLSCSLLVVPLALLLLLIDKFIPFVPSHFILIDLLILAFVTGFWTSFMKSRSLSQSAARIDRIAGLQEVLTTAVELESANTRHPFAPIVVRDALQAIERIRPGSLSPLVNLRRVKLLIVSLIGLLVLSLVPGVAYESGASVRHGVSASSTTLSSLRRAAEKLQKAHDSEIQVLGRRLEDVSDPSSQLDVAPWKVSSSLRKISTALSHQSKMRSDMIEVINTLSEMDHLQRFADATRSGMRSEINNAIDILTKRIARGEISLKKREEIAEQLRKLSHRITYNALSHAVKETASAIQNGNAGDARAALEYLGELIEDDIRRRDTLAMITEALSAAEDMKGQLASSVSSPPCPVCNLRHPADYACPEDVFAPSSIPSRRVRPFRGTHPSGEMNLREYRRAATHAIQSKRIPPEYEDVVRKYFDNLSDSEF